MDSVAIERNGHELTQQSKEDIDDVAADRLIAITPLADGRVRWTSLGGESERTSDVAALPASVRLLLVVPGEEVVLERVGFAQGERKLLHRTIPYALEDRLLSDIDQLHFAFGPLRDDVIAVAVVARAWLDRWLAALETETRPVEAVVPEPLLLIAAADEWALHVDSGQERWVARLGEDRGFALQPAAARLALAAAVREFGPPCRLLLSGVSLSAAPELALPTALAELLAPGAGFAVESQRTVVINLRQGPYVRRLPWRRWQREWRWPAVALVAALLLHFAVAALEYRRLHAQNLELRREIEQVYRSVEPRGVLTDAEVQLRRRVAALAGSQQGGFLRLLAPVGQALSAIDGIELQTLNFSDARQELRLNLVAASFKDVETLRLAIAKQGLTAQLVGTSSAEGKTRAQLLVADTALAAEVAR